MGVNQTLGKDSDTPAPSVDDARLQVADLNSFENWSELVQCIGTGRE